MRLKRYNEWRRSGDGEQPEPKNLGLDIDAAIASIESLVAAKSRINVLTSFIDDLAPDGWHIEYNPKPIPRSSHDWDFWHDNYDGAPDGNNRLFGTAMNIRDALEQIEEIGYAGS